MKKNQIIKNELGKIIIRRLFEMNQNQKWLAEQCKVTPTTISYIINGNRNPSNKLIYGISQNLNLNFDFLLKVACKDVC